MIYIQPRILSDVHTVCKELESTVLVLQTKIVRFKTTKSNLVFKYRTQFKEYVILLWDYLSYVSSINKKEKKCITIFDMSLH